MQINLTQAAKRFNKEWIFSKLDFQLKTGHHYALIGNNGSGKSTLLQIIAGYIGLTKGQISWEQEGSSFNADTIFTKISIAAPYLELIEEYTALEQITFHKKFKPLLNGIHNEALLSAVGLEKSGTKQIRNFSSGMKQRLKLGLAIFDQSPLLLLDEPCSNLDQEGIAIYHSLIQKYALDKLIIVASNDPNEYNFCDKSLALAQFKETN